MPLHCPRHPCNPVSSAAASSMPLLFLPCEQRTIGKEKSSLEYPRITFILCFKLLLAGIVICAEQAFIKGRGYSRREWEQDLGGYLIVKGLIQSHENPCYRNRYDTHSLLY